MSPLHLVTPSPLLLLTLSLLLSFSLTTAGAQQLPTEATVHRNDGLIQSVRILSANNNGIMWSSREATGPQLMPHDEIATVDFPEPDLWKQGNNYFHKGDYPKAIAAFSSLASNPRGNFYPTPGNYTSRARLRLIECYRETGNTEAIVETADGLDAGSLPKAERDRMEVISARAELSKENWEEALAKAEAVSANPITPDRNDLGFVKAVALEKTGMSKEAIIAYGTAYTVDFGASRELSKRAVQSAILLLINLNSESREAELHSLVHIYAKVYNKGKLWEGAPAKAVELLEKNLDLPQKKPEPEAEKEPVKGESDTSAEPEPPEQKAKAKKPAPKAKGKANSKAKAKAKVKPNSKAKTNPNPKGGKPSVQSK